MTNNTVPTVFEKLLQPIDDFVRKQDQQLPHYPNQKFFYYDFACAEPVEAFVGMTKKP